MRYANGSADLYDEPMTKSDRKRLRNGLLFASPYIVGFTAFFLYPLLASIYYSFCRYNAMRHPVWIGLRNYADLFFHDPLFWKSLGNTLYYTAFAVPLSLAFSITIALLLNAKIRGMSVYRTVFFLPTVVPIVASSVLWLWVLNPTAGIVNILLGKIGIEGPGWMSDPAWSKPALITLGLWNVGTAIVIFLAGLKDVPEQLYEAASIDGANTWHRLRHVTLPMLTPTILFNLIIGLITAFQYFTQVFVMTNGLGTPADSTMFYSLYLYRNAFAYLKMGYASALAWMLFVVILVCTVVVLKTSARWVYYQGSEE